MKLNKMFYSRKLNYLLSLSHIILAHFGLRDRLSCHFCSTVAYIAAVFIYKRARFSPRF